MSNNAAISDIYARETCARTDLVIPEKGFIKDYYSYACPLTEAPESFHLFVAFALAAAVCSRNVFFRLGPQVIYPNIWILLVAPSSRCRKTTAVNMGRSLLWKLENDYVYPNEFSSEALLELLQERPQGLFCWSEFGGVLEQFNRSYMIGTKEMLTDLYDCPQRHTRHLKKDIITIENPCISILSASTVAWLNSKLREDDIMSGFLARFVYVSGTEPSKLLPIPPVPDPAVQSELVSQLEQISRVEGEVTLSQEAKEMYEDWYTQHKTATEKEQDFERIAPFLSRLETYLLKFAMLYQISEDHSCEIQVHNMKMARDLVEMLRVNIRCLLDTGLVFSQEERDVQKALKIIKQEPGIDRSSLLRKFRHGKMRLDDAVATLVDREDIRVDSKKKATHFHPQNSRVTTDYGT